MQLGEHGQVASSFGGELDPHGPLINQIRHPLHQAGVLTSVYELHGAVVADQEMPRHLAHRRAGATVMAPDDQQELVLSRSQPGLASLGSAPFQEPAQTIA